MNGRATYGPRGLVRAGTTVLAGAVALLCIAATSAQADPTPPAESKQAQQIAEQLQRAPGGVVINDHQISYDNGAVIVTVETDGMSVQGDASECPQGWFCVWSESSYSGKRYQFHDAGKWQNMDNYGVPWFYSMFNRRTNRIFFRDYPNQPSTEICYQAGTKISNAASIKKKRGIYLAESNNPC
jgi:hypothetical protein